MWLTTLIIIINLIFAVFGCSKTTEPNAETITDSATITQPKETGTVTDFDGNVYKTVKIGDQWWMAENLKVIHTPDGSPLESILYNNDATYLEEYGRLYTWTTAMNGSTTAGAQGIAPDGWHIPSKDEWEELISYLGGYYIAGGRLKEAGHEHWNEPNSRADNSSGFTAVGSGTLWRGVFYSLKEIAYFWCSTQFDEPTSFRFDVSFNSGNVGHPRSDKIDYFAIRCVKNN